ncbi:hypothetical protein CYMTET_25212, partial [Cymbomonas tetramitiformis]
MPSLKITFPFFVLSTLSSAVGRCSKSLWSILYCCFIIDIARKHHTDSCQNSLRGSCGYVAGAPLAGGGGYAVYFDHQRSDISSWIWSPPQSAALSVDVWVYPFDPHLRSNPIADFDTSYFSAESGQEISDPYGFSLKISDGRGYAYASTHDLQCEIEACEISHAASQVEWHHLALTINYTSGEYIWYIDGNEVQVSIADGLLPTTANGVFSLGVETAVFQSNFKAGDHILDEFHIWETVLSAERVAEMYLYPGDLTGFHQDMNLRFSFNDLIDVNGKLYFKDETGNGNDASYGHISGFKQTLSFAETGIQPITKPRIVASQANIYGNDIVLFVHPGEDVEITLRGKDATGDSLITSIISMPQSSSNISAGVLMSLDNNTLAIGSVVGTDSVEGAGLEARVRYTAPSDMQGDLEWKVQFMYSVTNTQGESAEATVIIRDQSSWNPEDKTYDIKEDSVATLILGSVDMNGLPLITFVTSLPSKGHLYQAAGSHDLQFYGEFPNQLTAPLTEGELPIQVTDTRGVLYYKPPQDEAVSGSPFTSFRYLWKFKSGAFSPEAACDVWVDPINDAPVSIPSSIVGDAYSENIEITLEQIDVDPTFATRPYHRILTWPKLGFLLQENGQAIEEEGGATVLQYVQEIPSFHEPTSTPSFSSQYSRDGPSCYIQETITDDLCTNSAYVNTNMIGKPQVYPSLADSILGWDFQCGVGCGLQYGVFKYANPVYISNAKLYEINRAGSLFRLSASSAWEGANTNWTTLWEGTPAPLLENTAREFSPPLCQEVQEKFQYVRLDFDPDAVPGWNNHEALGLEGSFEVPKGQVFSSSGVISYSPMGGVHSFDGSTPIDQFTSVASDCLDEEEEGAIITLAVRAPEPGTGSLFAAAKQILHFMIDDETTVDIWFA